MVQFSGSGLCGALAALALLAGCGGGGLAVTTPPPTNPTTPTTPTVPIGTPVVTGDTAAEKFAAANALVSTYAATVPIAYTPLSSVPTTGIARYSGVLFGDVSRNSTISARLIGDFAATVTFSAQSVAMSGAATNFVDSDDTVFSGSLTLSSAALDRAGNPANNPTLSALLNGTLTPAGGAAMQFGGRIEGDFLGATHGGIGGDVLGRITSGGVNSDFDGGFIAGR